MAGHFTDLQYVIYISSLASSRLARLETGWQDEHARISGYFGIWRLPWYSETNSREHSRDKSSIFFCALFTNTQLRINTRYAR